MTYFDIPANSLNPDTSDVIDAFSKAKDDEPKKLKLLMVASDNETAAELVPYSLTYESGSPGMFLFRGTIVLKGEEEEREAKGFYNGSDRSGHVQVF